MSGYYVQVMYHQHAWMGASWHAEILCFRLLHWPASESWPSIYLKLCWTICMTQNGVEALLCPFLNGLQVNYGYGEYRLEFGLKSKCHCRQVILSPWTRNEHCISCDTGSTPKVPPELLKVTGLVPEQAPKVANPRYLNTNGCRFRSSVTAIQPQDN